MDKEKFIEKLIPITESGCMIWEGRGTRYGLCYTGNPAYSRGQEMSHRVSYKLFKGEIPEGMIVMHKCDVPLCCNPEHLILGTMKLNAEDCQRKGRANHPRKLSQEQLEEIKEMRRRGLQIKEIAKIFSINRGYCSRLVKGCQPKGVINCHA